MDQLRQCQNCLQFRHVTEFNVGWRDCFTCENQRRKLLSDIGMVTPDQLYAESEEKIWRHARKHGQKIERLIN